eukprot:363516-Chlamydomonas_euryale.AAC.19
MSCLAPIRGSAAAAPRPPRQMRAPLPQRCRACAPHLHRATTVCKSRPRKPATGRGPGEGWKCEMDRGFAGREGRRQGLGQPHAPGLAVRPAAAPRVDARTARGPAPGALAAARAWAGGLAGRGAARGVARSGPQRGAHTARGCAGARVAGSGGKNRRGEREGERKTKGRRCGFQRREGAERKKMGNRELHAHTAGELHEHARSSCVPGRRARVPGRGARMPGRRARMPGRGARMPGRGARMPGRGARMPCRGARMPGRRDKAGRELHAHTTGELHAHTAGELHEHAGGEFRMQAGRGVRSSASLACWVFVPVSRALPLLQRSARLGLWPPTLA